MSRRIIHVLTDDLDGTDADDTIRFGMDGIEYEIDLSLPNANSFREMMRRYVDAGRKVGKMAGGGRQVVKVPSRDGWLDRAAAGGSTQHSTYNPEAKAQRIKIREWAKNHGVHVPDRGRIRADILAAFEAKDPTMMESYRPPAGANGSTNATRAVPAAAFQPAGVTPE